MLLWVITDFTTLSLRRMLHAIQAYNTKSLSTASALISICKLASKKFTPQTLQLIGNGHKPLKWTLNSYLDLSSYEYSSWRKTNKNQLRLASESMYYLFAKPFNHCPMMEHNNRSSKHGLFYWNHFNVCKAVATYIICFVCSTIFRDVFAFLEILSLLFSYHYYCRNMQSSTP